MALSLTYLFSGSFIGLGQTGGHLLESLSFSKNELKTSGFVCQDLESDKRKVCAETGFEEGTFATAKH